MSKFLSGRLRRLLVGITGYTENNTVVQTTGKVGIGTTDAQQHSLYVVGSTNITGDNIVGGGLTAVGIGSFQNDVYIDNELYVGGVNVTGGSSVHEDITTRNLKVTGISTVVGISTVESTLFAKELSVAGVSTFVGGIEIPDNSIARFGDVPGVLDTSVYHTGNTFYIENYSANSNLSVNFDSSLSFGNGGGTGLYLFTDIGTLESYVEVQYTDPNTLGNADSGSFRVDGGAGIAENLTVGAGLSVTDGTFLSDVSISGLSTFQGNVRLPDQVKLLFGGGSGSTGTAGDLQIYHTGAASYISDQGTGALVIKGSDVILEQGGDIAVRAQNNAAELYNNGNKRLETTGYGVTVFDTLETQQLNVTGLSTFQNNVHLLDNDKLLIGGSVGTHDGLEIYHDGNHSYIDDSGTGNLFLRSGTLSVQNLAGSKTSAVFQSGSSQQLYFNNSLKFETTGIGVSISNGGTDTATIAGPENLILDPAAVGDNTGIVRIKGDLYVDGTEFKVDSSTINLADLKVGIATDVSTSLLLDGGGIGIGDPDVAGLEKTLLWNHTNNRMEFNANLYAPNFYTGNIEASDDVNLDENLNVVGTTTTGQLVVTGIATFQSHAKFGDSDKAIFGQGSDMEIYHSGSQNRIDTKNTPLRIDNSSTGIILWDDANTNNMARFNTGGSVDLYHNGTKRLETTGYGVTVYNDLRVGTAVTISGNAGIISAIAFYGDGSNLTNTGATLSATSGVERLVTTQLTSGTMVDAATDADLTFDAGTNTLNTENIKISGGISTNGTNYGTAGQLLRSASGGKWEWATVPGIFSVNNILNGFNVLEEGGTVGTAGSIHTLDFRGINVTATADPQPNGIATVTFSPTPTFTDITVTGNTTIPNVVGVTTFSNNVHVGSAISMYAATGIVSATAFYGDGSNLSNTGATLSAATGTQRLVLTSLTSGTMVDAATDGDLNFTAETNELAVPNLDVGTAAEISRLNVTGVSTFSNDVKFDGATTGRDITFDRSSNALQFEDWATAKFGSGTDNLSIYHNGANSIISNDGSDSGSIYIRVTKDNERVHIQSDNGSGGLADYFAAYGNTGEARLYHFGNQKFSTKSSGIEVTGTTDTDQLNVSGVSTFQAKIEGAATNNVIPFLYANYSDLPSASTYHGAFAHVHATGKAYYAHANAWYELVNKDLNGVVGTGTETYNVANINITGITTLGGPVTAGSSEGVAGQYLRHVGTGVTWANFPTLRTTQTFTALAGQTTFNFTYNVDFLDVYVNGVKLSPSEYTATNGSDVVLDIAAFAGDTVELYSYNTASTYGGGGGSSYTDANVNTHLNVSGASAGQILSWNGSDYAWVADQTGGGGGVGVNTSQFDVNNLHVSGISTFASGLKVPGGSGVSNRIELGNSQEFTLQYNTASTKGLLTAAANPIEIQATTIKLLPNVGENGVIVNQNGSVELYHDNVQKFETTGYGVTVTGIASATSFSGDGSALTGLTGASAATYGNATAVPQITVDANGRITGISNVSISGGGGGGGTSLFIRDGGSLVGSAGTIDFGTGLSVSPVSAGIVTVTVSSSGISLTDLSVTQNSAGTAALSYNNSNGVFTYTPPDLSSYLTSYTETDPVVAAVNGIVKSNGTTISAATAGTDYLAPGSEFTSQWTFSASNASNYQVTGPGFAANSTDPTIYVMRGHKYKFTNNAGSHPLQIQYEFENASATAYTDGITNSNNVITWEVRNDTPDLLHYQCTSHDAMSGRIVVLGDVVTKGEWSASAGVAQTLDTITGVANNDIKTAEYTIHIENGSNMQAQKVLVMQDGTTAFSQEYGIMHKSGLLVSMSATISGGNLLLQATPETGVSGTTTYRITRQTMR